MLSDITIPLPNEVSLPQIAIFVFLLLALVWSIRRIKGPLPVISDNHTLNVLAWFGLALMLPGALLFLVAVFELLMLVISFPSAADNPAEVRWHSSIMLALLAALGAIVGLVFAFIRVLTTERQTQTAEQQARHNEDVLFNERLTEATRDLYAGRQTTKNADDRENAYDVWEDDIIRRNAAIDTLERLVEERPETAAGVARMLSVYVRELSKEHPAVEPPQEATPDGLRDRARELELQRSDMEKAVQTLGRLRRYDDTLAIDLRDANLQKMALSHLDFEAALLTGGQLQGAHLIMAQLQGADLNGAQLQGAHLSGAQLQEADLIEAELQGADLRLVQLQGADLTEAQLHGADLTEARMDEATDLSTAILRGAVLRSVDYTHVTLSQKQVESVFGDASVTLPNGIDAPEWFSRSYEGYDKFYAAWGAWQKEIGFDPDTPEG